MKVTKIILVLIIVFSAGVFVGSLLSSESNPSKNKIAKIDNEFRLPPTKKETIKWIKSKVKSLSHIVSIKIEGHIIYFVGLFKKDKKAIINKIDLSKVKDISLIFSKKNDCFLKFESKHRKRAFLFSTFEIKNLKWLDNLWFIKRTIRRDEKAYHYSTSTILLDNNPSPNKKLRLDLCEAIKHLSKLSGGCNSEKKLLIN